MKCIKCGKEPYAPDAGHVKCEKLSHDGVMKDLGNHRFAPWSARELRQQAAEKAYWLRKAALQAQIEEEEFEEPCYDMADMTGATVGDDR